MNYFNYINSIKPNSDLKNNTKARIQLEISKQNIKSRNAKRAYISMAACFIILIASIFTAKVLTKNPEYIENTTERTTQSLSIPVHINTDDSGDKPQGILIGENLYIQYRKRDMKKSESNKDEISKADIGELLYTIDESNLVDGMQVLSNPETERSKGNKFFNAEVYRLNNYEDDTVILVKEKDKEEYYLFYLANRQ